MDNTAEGMAVAANLSAQPSAAQMQYYPLTKKWQKIKRHLADEQLKKIMKRDFGKFVRGRWGQQFLDGHYPRDFETCHWDDSHRGRKPEWWRYVKHAACHWTVPVAAVLANEV